MTNPIRRLINRLPHRDAGESSPLCFYDVLHRDWIRLTPGQHIALIGVSGSGKSNLISDLLANIQPDVDDGLALIFGIDLKGGVELDRFGGYLADLATTPDETITMLERLDRMLDERMRILRTEHQTSTRISRETPLILVVVDEAAELTGAIDKTTKQKQEQVRVLLDRALRLGRACGFTILLASQDPRKEAFPLRDRCPVRISLRLNSIEETRLLLGDNAIQAGAAPWLIGAKQPGTGYLYDADAHKIVRFRGQHVPDDVIDEIRGTHPMRTDKPHEHEHSDEAHDDREDPGADARRATRMA